MRAVRRTGLLPASLPPRSTRPEPSLRALPALPALQDLLAVQPSPLAPANVAFTLLEEADVARSLAREADGLEAVGHALRAHALASAERFEELLALRLMQGVEPHRYQIETVRRVLRVFRGRALLADEVGLGKTVEALMILREYHLRGAVRRALILVPPALVGQWVGELTAKAGIVPRSTEDPAERADPEAFWRGEGVVVASVALARAPRHLAAVQAEPWDILIVDEAHHVKNRASASFKLVDGIKSRYLLLLTATPIETGLLELYNLVTLLKPGQFATPAAFRAQFVDKKDPLSPKNRERLRSLLAEVMVRNTRADSGLKLPPRFVSTVAVEPLPEERALYDEVIAFLRAHGSDKETRMLATTLLLEAGSSPSAVQGTLERARVSEARAPSLRDAIDALARKAQAVRTTRKGKALVDLVRAHPGQMLVFTRFRDTLAYLERALREAGVPPLVFHGGLGPQAKQAALEAFRGGAKLMLATDVGGEGQNLHHCHVLVNFDLPYNPMLIEQRIGRLHRMGQREEVRVYNLCARGTAEERVLDLLDRRLHLFELVVGEMDMVLGNLADERDLEERIVALYAQSRSDAEIERGFDAIEAELAEARGRYEQVKSLDSALFGKDYEA
jgi:SNF2 family DNA or RNA helicase